MSLSKQEVEVLKKLASQYMEIASLTVHKEKRDLWKALNRGKMKRPMVCIDQLPYNELNANGDFSYQISDPYWRNVEHNLRNTIFTWNNFPVDMVVEPYITIPKVISNSGYGIRTEIHTLRLDEDTTAASVHYDNVLKDFEDIEKIKDMEITLDETATNLHFEEAKEIFKGIAPIIQGHGIGFSLSGWDRLNEFMGLQNLLIDLYDRPDFMHACIDRVTDATIAGIVGANKLQVHDDIVNLCHCSHIYTDELLPDFGQGKGPLSQNSWAFGLAQPFTAVSPQFFNEFEMPYISRMAKHFGMIYYGCCDRMDDRLEFAKKIPNVKKLSCSPWSDRKNFAENIGPDIVMSNKPTPAFLAGDSVDWDEVMKDLQLTADLAKSNGANLEFILKDISTVNSRPERINQWAELAMRIVEDF
ncbi:MAG: hypothetical protein WCQ41_00010 [Bacillota bacterium]